MAIASSVELNLSLPVDLLQRSVSDLGRTDMPDRLVASGMSSSLGFRVEGQTASTRHAAHTDSLYLCI